MKTEYSRLPVGESVSRVDLSRIEAMLARLEAKVDALDEKIDTLAEQLQERRHPRPSVDADDREFLSNLLSALGDAFRSTPFLTKDIFEIPALRALVEEYSPSRLGSILARVAERGEPVDGFLLTRIKIVHNARMWVITLASS